MEQLVERAQQGDKDAFEALLARVAPAVHRFGLRMCRSAADADDVLQDTLFTLTQQLDQFRGEASFTSWVFTLARSACARRRRGLKNNAVDAVDPPEQTDLAPSPEARVSDQELATLVSEALDSMAEDHREVILLRDVEGLSATEVASALQVSVDSVKSRLHRARESLRSKLQPLLEPRLRRLSSCPDVMLRWSRKLEGDLSQADCTAMEQHLLGCAACGATCDNLKRALLACRQVSAIDVPTHVQERVKIALRAWAQSRHRSGAQG